MDKKTYYKSDKQYFISNLKFLFCREFCNNSVMLCKNEKCLIKNLNDKNMNSFQIKDLFINGNDTKFKDIYFIRGVE